MNFFQITFINGKSLEIKAYDDEQGMLRGLGVIKRWNQPRAEVFRTSPYDTTFRNPLICHINPDYDPTKPILDKDPIFGYKEKAKKPKKERIKGDKVSTKSAGPRSTYEVPLKDLADKLGIAPGLIRRKLRAGNVDKPEGGWGWNTWEDPTVKQIESWFGGE